tara:strand:+ start:1185 stop:1331 length:147 start_codon:yes stop_codon:yes gene_type:complete
MAFLFELAIADFLALSPLSINNLLKEFFTDINFIVTNFYKISTIFINI